jgi:YHS domain-containing protein
MVRNVFRLFLVFIAALFVRRVVQLIVQGFSQASRAPGPPPPPEFRPQLDGELKKDPVCGTFVAVSSSIKKTVNGEVVHFCSTACRDKYQRVA